ncbi:MAG: ATP-binding protein [Solirubrobacterales bacterium]
MIARNIEAELHDILSVSRAAALLGPRQAGKSTLAKQIRWSNATPEYLTLDDDGLRANALSDPAGFIAGVRRPAVIDEVQRAPGLMLAIKQVLDTDSQTPGQFLLTGSANLVTSRHVADALPGRVQYVNLWPLSQGEIEGRRESLIDQLLNGDVPHIANAARGRIAHAERIIEGGYPDARLLTTSRRRGGFFDSYLEGVIGRDLPEISGVRTDPARIQQLFRLLAARTSGAVNFQRLGNELDLNDTTIKAHLTILEQIYQVFRLRPWSANLGSRQVKTPKFFLTDTGLAAGLIGLDAARYSAIDQGGIAGMLLETFVVMELVKQRTWSEQRTHLYFYRDNLAREVDVVIESVSGDIAAVEVKSAATVDRASTKGLRYLRDKLGSRFKAGVVLYSGEHTLRLDDRVWAMPIEGLWSGG